MRSLTFFVSVVAVLTTGSSTALTEIQRSESWTILHDEAYVTGDPSFTYASATSDGEDDCVTARAIGSMSVWTTVDAELEWEYFIRVQAHGDVFVHDNQSCFGLAVADASAEGPDNNSNTLQAVALGENPVVNGVYQNGSYYGSDDAGEPDGIWRHNPMEPEVEPWRFFADEGVSASQDAGVLASVPLESTDRASAWALAEAWGDLYIP
jgi:hypothetical protein